MSLGLGHRRAQKLVDEFEIIPYKFFQREPMNFAIGRQLNFLIGLMMIYIYLIGNRTIRPKKYDSAWPNKKQRILAAFLSFLFGQGRIV
jgi:hypothetical protein